MWAIAYLLLVFLICLDVDVQAAGDLDKKTQQELVQLETKYFGHSYDADTDDNRVERLEKLIFGEPAAGDPEERIEKLAVATASGSGLDNLNSEGSAGRNDHPASNLPTKSKTASIAPPPSEDSDNSDDTDDTASTDTGSYPHITALENEILGKNFEGKPLLDRLNRMETQAFGYPSKNTDLSQRTDALEQYAEMKLHKSPYGQDSDETATATPQTRPQAQAQAQAASQPQSQFQTVSQSPSQTQTASPSQAQPQPKSQQSRLPQQILSMLGNSLLGSMGGGFGGIGPGFGPGGLNPGGMSSGPGSFSGVGIRRRSQATQQQQPSDNEQQPETPHDDPAVFAVTPPPANARTLVKVGWCEVQVFGHTFPNMHLEERLSQLNIELQFRPGASNMALLDDIGPMIKAVQTHQSASAK